MFTTLLDLYPIQELAPIVSPLQTSPRWKGWGKRSVVFIMHLRKAEVLKQSASYTVKSGFLPAISTWSKRRERVSLPTATSIEVRGTFKVKNKNWSATSPETQKSDWKPLSCKSWELFRRVEAGPLSFAKPQTGPLLSLCTLWGFLCSLRCSNIYSHRTRENHDSTR